MSIAYWKGDCLDVMDKLTSKSIDCFICDLPYGCLSGRAIGKTAEDKKCWSGDINGCDWDVKIDLDKFWKQVKRLAKNDNTPVIMFCTTKFGAELIASNPDWFRYDLVWNKSLGVGFLSANKMPLRSHEMIYVFSKKGAFYSRVDVEGDYKGTTIETGLIGGSVYECDGRKKAIKRVGTKEGVRCVKSVIEIKNKKERGGHPTQKPAELYEWILKRYCPPNGCVLDPTAGSFTSCIVAKELGYNAIGIEKNNAFFYKALSSVL